MASRTHSRSAPSDAVAELQRRLARLEIIATLQARSAELDLTLADFMAELVKVTASSPKVTGAVVEIVEGDAMVYRAVSPSLKAHLGLRLRREGSLSGLCVEASKALYCRDSETDPRVDREACRRLGVGSMICAPLLGRTGAVGVLKAIANQPNAFDDEDIEALEMLAKAMASAMARQVAQEALDREAQTRRELAARFESAFNQAPIGMALVGLDGQFLRLNSVFCDIVGYTEAELLASNFQTITHADDLDRDLQLLQQLTAGEIASYQMDKRYLHREGRVVWVTLSVSMVREVSGAPSYYVAQVQDLTARMEAEARYRLMAENTTDMIVTADLEGRTTFVSAASRAMTGWTPAQALGLKIEDYVHPEDLRRVRQTFARTAAGEAGLRVRWRGRHLTEDRWLWLESSPSLNSDSGTPFFIDVVRDIDEQVQQEALLAEARRDAEAGMAAKNEFLANMSHEIRTPLTAVVGFSGLLRMREDLTPPVARFAERIESAAKNLLGLVNDILDFSKLEAGGVEARREPVDVPALTEETLALFQAQAAAKGLALALERTSGIPARLSTDPQCLRQLLTNLLGNAVKFTDAGSVTVAVSYADGALRLDVRDTGPGIEEEQQARLFQRFTQGDGSSTRRHGGTGLGLAICKSLAEVLGGDISVRSAPGAGSTFTFAAPTAEVEAEPAFA